MTSLVGTSNGRHNMATCKCSAQWGGENRCHCGSCHRTFSGITLFDRHRSQDGDNGTCLDPAAIRTEAGRLLMVFRNNMWSYPAMDEQQRAQRAVTWSNHE